MKIQTGFWDFIAEKYSRAPVRDEESYQKKLQKTREYFRPDSEVFEFGCGTGSTAIYHAPYVRKITAIDVSGKMIAIAQGKAKAKNITNITFSKGSIEDYQAVDASYDVVMAHSILHLLQNKDQVLAKVHTMLKPGGVFVSSSLCMGETFLKRAIATVDSLLSYTGLLPYICKFTAEELVASIQQAGFTIEHQWRKNEKSAVFIIARKS